MVWTLLLQLVVIRSSCHVQLSFLTWEGERPKLCRIKSLQIVQKRLLLDGKTLTRATRLDVERELTEPLLLRSYHASQNSKVTARDGDQSRDSAKAQIKRAKHEDGHRLKQGIISWHGDLSFRCTRAWRFLSLRRARNRHAPSQCIEAALLNSVSDKVICLSNKIEQWVYEKIFKIHKIVYKLK